MVSKLLFTLLLTVCGLFCHAQDVIVLKNLQELPASIVSVGTNDIIYQKNQLADSPKYEIPAKDVIKIKFANGSEQRFSKYNNIDELKTFIENQISAYGIDRDNDSYKAEGKFDGNIFSFYSVNKKGKRIGKADLWDLSRILKFHPISTRDKGIAYLNIVAMEKKSHTDEIEKLVIKMTDVEQATVLLDAFKELDSFYKTKNR